MKIENLKKGHIVSVAMTIGYAPEESEKFVEIKYIIGTVSKIDNTKNLVQVTHSPDVMVSPQYVQGILISELVLKRLGWDEIEVEKIDVPKPMRSSIKTGYQRAKQQIFQKFDGSFHFVRSKSSPSESVKYVHDLQELGITDLEPWKLLNK